jgi:cobalt-precorrin 5A hydrolase
MVGGQAMESVIAIGVGCRKNCAGAALKSVVSRALQAWPNDLQMCGQQMLFTIEDKRGEPGLDELAAAFGLELKFLSRQALRDAMPAVKTRSTRVEQLFGVASVAEASALAGAGPHATLIVARLSEDGATCAIAANLSSILDQQP